MKNILDLPLKLFIRLLHQKLQQMLQPQNIRLLLQLSPRQYRIKRSINMRSHLQILILNNLRQHIQYIINFLTFILSLTPQRQIHQQSSRIF